MNKNIGVVWLREDFRILKNDALIYASQNHEQVCAIYIYKKRTLIIGQLKDGGFFNQLKTLKIN
jgi:deoxyribodipyrimidine photolyase